jgi:DNA-binding MarR family transcriptional regulator
VNQSPRRTGVVRRYAPQDDSRAALRNWLRLLDCSTLVENEVRRRLRAQFHTTLPRFDVLAQLDRARRERVPGLTMSELSRRLMVTNGNLTSLIERLAQEKLIRRASSASDKRMSIISLTPAGKRTLDAMTPAHRKWIVGMFDGLSSEEGEQLYALLDKLRTSIRDSLSQPEDA